ncbi:MAG: glycosyltransferase family 1 protein [Endomicrobiia bacterium]|nr:glycosyltransferase family 1 protein [Endomicrobiia bacterium]
MKKIVVDARELTATPTGGRKFLRHLLAGMCSSGRYEVMLALNQRVDGNIPEIAACQVRRRRENIRFVYDHLTLSRMAREFNADFFYSPYAKVPLLFKGAKISSFFDVTYLHSFSGVSTSSRMIYEKFLLKIYSKSSAAVITLSRTSAEELGIRLRIPADKIKIISPGVDSMFRPSSEDEKKSLRGRYSLPEDYILYVGNSKPHKNVRALERAHGLLPSEVRENYPLALAGVGDNYRPLSPGAVVIAHPPEEDMPALYGAASLFVFPSLAEGFGLTPLEAMACGCPVASSEVSCMPEVLGDACAYFNPRSDESIAASILTVISGDDIKKRLVVKGLARAALYDPRNVYTKFAEILEEIR